MSEATEKAKRPGRPKTDKPKKEKPVLTSFIESAPSEILSPEGLLTVHEGLDAHGYDRAKHERLTREDFASESIYMNFKIVDMRKRGNALLKRADEVERLVKAGGDLDPAKRAQVKRVQKLASAFAALKAQLAKDGVNVDELLAATGGLEIAADAAEEN